MFEQKGWGTSSLPPQGTVRSQQKGRPSLGGYSRVAAPGGRCCAATGGRGQSLCQLCRYRRPWESPQGLFILAYMYFLQRFPDQRQTSE